MSGYGNWEWIGSGLGADWEWIGDVGAVCLKVCG
jgi:hypothetical protein